ncbi:uncharacterized protein WM277_011160 isoform 2-T2 [Molossus nigricans]
MDLGKNTVTHLFLFLPECPYPLLERDLLQRSFNCWPLPLQASLRIKFHETLAVNPASLPPDDDPEKLLQDGLGEISTADCRPDLKDDPLPSSDEFLQALQSAQKAIHKHICDALPVPTSNLCTRSSSGIQYR